MSSATLSPAAGRRPRQPHHSLAAGRRRICGPPAAPRSATLEHRGRPAGERGACSSFTRARRTDPDAGLVCSDADLSQLLCCRFQNQSRTFWHSTFCPSIPLDGGQILRSLLWFVLGRARSLLVATILGFVGVAAFIGLAVWTQSLWTGAIAVFMLLNCWSGLQHARALLRLDKLPRREAFACPACKAAPPVGDIWKCAQCGQLFDTFQNKGACPYCGSQFQVIRCVECGTASPISEWTAPVVSSTFTNEVRG